MLRDVHISKPIQWFVGFCLFLFFAGGITYMHQDLRLQKQTWSGQKQDLFYLPSRKNLQRISLGHKTLMADMIWIRALLYAGSHFTKRSSIHWLPRYVDAIVTLDPKFRKPYVWGAVVMLYNRIGSYREHIYKSIAILKRGQLQFPNAYEFPYQLALNYLYEIKFAGRSLKQLKADNQLFCKSNFFQRTPLQMADLKELRVNPIKLWEQRYRSGGKPSATWMKLFHETKKCMQLQAAAMMLEASSKPDAPGRVAMLAATLLKKGGNSNLVICEHLQDLLWGADSKQVRDKLRTRIKRYCSPDVLRVLFCREWLFTKRWQEKMPYIPRRLFDLVDVPKIYQRVAPLSYPLPTFQQDCKSLPKR